MRYRMRVLFWLRKNKINPITGEAAIYCRITVNGMRTNDFTTGIFTSPGNWNAAKQRIKNDTVQQTRLEQIRNRLATIHVNMEMQDLPITSDIIKNTYLKKDARGAVITVGKLIEDFKNFKLSQSIESSTIKSIKNQLRVVADFFKAERKYNYYLGQLNTDTADELINFIEMRNYKPGYGMKIIRIARACFEYAIKNKFTNSNPFNYIRLKQQSTKLLTLDKIKLEMLFDFSFKSERLKRVADLFLFQCYTGMAYVDMMNFDANTHIQGRFIIIKRQKTATESLIPLLPNTLKILERRENTLPRLSLQRYNFYLKEIGEMIGLGFPLTTHIGRKTCGNILLNAGMSIESVSRILGHVDIRITSRLYTRVNEHRINKELDEMLRIAG